MENLCFQEHKFGIRRKHEEYAGEVTKYRVLCSKSKRGPPDRPNRPTKPQHRLSDIRAHQAVSQRRTVARGGKVGPAEPPLSPVQVHFGRKIDLILLKAV